LTTKCINRPQRRKLCPNLLCAGYRITHLCAGACPVTSEFFATQQSNFKRKRRECSGNPISPSLYNVNPGEDIFLGEMLVSAPSVKVKC